MLNGFKKFIMQGNVVELAVAFVIGVAFKAIIDAVVTGLVTPLVGVIMPDSAKDLANASTTINGSPFRYGLVLNQIIVFLATAAAVYFLIIVPMNALKARRSAGAEADVELSNEEKMVALLERIAEK